MPLHQNFPKLEKKNDPHTTFRQKKSFFCPAAHFPPPHFKHKNNPTTSLPGKGAGGATSSPPLSQRGMKGASPSSPPLSQRGGGWGWGLNHQAKPAWQLPSPFPKGRGLGVGFKPSGEKSQNRNYDTVSYASPTLIHNCLVLRNLSEVGGGGLLSPCFAPLRGCSHGVTEMCLSEAARLRR